MRAGIEKRRQDLGRLPGRPVPPANFHITLVFLGNCPDGDLDRVIRVCQEVQAPAFDMVLDRFGQFPRAGVVWLGGPAPEAASRLVAALRVGLEQAGVGYRNGGWVPHVTLVRRSVLPQPPSPAPVRWSVEDFSLVESISGRPYQVLRTWSLSLDNT